MEIATGEPHWWVFKPLKSCGWAVIAVVREKEVMSQARQWLNARMIRLLAALGLVVALVWVVSNWTTRPLRQLTASARAVAGGNLDAEVRGVRSRDEIGQFAGTFNEMLRDLKASLQAKQREIVAPPSDGTRVAIGPTNTDFVVAVGQRSALSTRGIHPSRTKRAGQTTSAATSSTIGCWTMARWPW